MDRGAANNQAYANGYEAGKELEELMSIKASGDAYMKNLQRDQNDHR